MHAVRLRTTCSNHQGAFNHLQLKGRLLALPCRVVVVVTPVLCQNPRPFIGCQAWSDTLQKLLALGVVWLEQEAAVCCDDCPAYPYPPLQDVLMMTQIGVRVTAHSTCAGESGA